MDESIIRKLTINGRTRRVVPLPENDLKKIRDNSGTDYILLCLDGALTQDEKSQLLKAGVNDLEYVGEDVYYLGQYESDDLTPVQKLTFVKGVDVYRRDFKITEELEQQINDAKKKAELVNIQVALHNTRREESIGETKKQLAAAVGVAIEQVTIDGAGAVCTIKSVEPTNIEGLANIDAIKSMQPVIERSISNDRARELLGVSFAHMDLPYQGEDQIIAIADTGLDIGKKTGLHPAFTDRVLEFLPVGRKTTKNSDDPIGHGTHVCGSAVGASIPGIPGFERVQGTAPKAQLVLQSLLKSNGTLASPVGKELYDLFAYPHKQYKANIHSNSWGESVYSDIQKPYDDVESKFVDRVVWDNPNLLIIMSAGNFGQYSRTAQIAGIAACKNVLTVGATDSTRPSIQGVPVKTKLSDNDPTEVSYYSSRGPTAEGRIKPDLLAPGTAILSAKTQAVKSLGSAYTDSDSNLFCYAFGTSMATPLVAGCAAVLREFLIKNGTPDPPAALLKALLINGTYAFHHAHSSNEGFGMVNVLNSLLPKDSPTGGYKMDTGFTDVKQTRDFSIEIPTKSTNSNATTNDTPTGPVPIVPGTTLPTDLRVSPPSRNGSTLKVTMVYNDYPGASLQNDLTMSVVASDKSFRNGNRGSSSTVDRLNNVEQIIWKGITPGTATVKISCERLLQAPQPFAVVWRIIPNES